MRTLCRYIEEQLCYVERATLLILHTFCIRLEHEDYSYIRAFIERHLSLRSVLRFPYHLQETSPPQLDMVSNYLSLYVLYLYYSIRLWSLEATEMLQKSHSLLSYHLPHFKLK